MIQSHGSRAGDGVRKQRRSRRRRRKRRRSRRRERRRRPLSGGLGCEPPARSAVRGSHGARAVQGRRQEACAACGGGLRPSLRLRCAPCGGGTAFAKTGSERKQFHAQDLRCVSHGHFLRLKPVIAVRPLNVATAILQGNSGALWRASRSTSPKEATLEVATCNALYQVALGLGERGPKACLDVAMALGYVESIRRAGALPSSRPCAQCCTAWLRSQAIRLSRQCGRSTVSKTCIDRIDTSHTSATSGHALTSCVEACALRKQPLVATRAPTRLGSVERNAAGSSSRVAGGKSMSCLPICLMTGATNRSVSIVNE